MIAPAVGEPERAAVYRLRYAVLVGEQGILADPSIDHDRRVVTDPADATGVLLAAWSDGELAGSVRTNMLRDGPARPFCEVLGLDGLSAAEREATSVTSRLLVATRWRRTPLGVRLAQAISRHCREAGMAWDYIAVRPALAPFFVRLGYERVGPATSIRGSAASSRCGSTSIRHTSDGSDPCLSRDHRDWPKPSGLRMRRRHLVELEDLAWWPGPFRDGVTDYLATVLRVFRPYQPLVSKLAAAVKRSGATRITDFCSGGGRPWLGLLPALRAAGVSASICLTDKFPNASALCATAANLPGVEFAPSRWTRRTSHPDRPDFAPCSPLSTISARRTHKPFSPPRFKPDRGLRWLS